MHQNIGINLFGCRKEIGADFEGTVQRLKDTGAAVIEPNILFLPKGKIRDDILKVRKAALSLSDEVFNTILKDIWFPEIAAEKIAYIISQGFKVISFHVMLSGWESEMLNRVLPALIEFAKTFKIKYIVVGF